MYRRTPLRDRSRPRVRGFLKGATTAAILLGALIVLHLKELKEPCVIAPAGLADLHLFGR